MQHGAGIKDRGEGNEETALRFTALHLLVLDLSAPSSRVWSVIIYIMDTSLVKTFGN